MLTCIFGVVLGMLVHFVLSFQEAHCSQTLSDKPCTYKNRNFYQICYTKYHKSKRFNLFCFVFVFAEIKVSLYRKLGMHKRIEKKLKKP